MPALRDPAPAQTLEAAREHTPAPVPFREALAFWFKLGFISFGGPAGQIAIMHAELVERRRWLSERRFLHALNYCMVLPGPEAQQLATYLGWLMHRRWGGVVAGALFVLPSLFILVALSWAYVALGQQPLVAGLFAGIKPAVLAIVLQAVMRIGGRVLRHPALWALAVATFAGSLWLPLPFPLVVLAALLIGAIGGRFAPAAFAVSGTPAPHAGTAPPQAAPVRAWMDDDSPVPAHARFSWPRLAGVLVAGALLWLLPMGLLLATVGVAHPYTQMAWFFTKAALLTVGGAYTVLPYVYQGAVQHYGWLTPAQMIDGLALGETTPGPLIMVVAFVGFVAAYGQALLGPEARFVAGALAALLVTWFTFLPSFIFILAGGPLVESTHKDLRLGAALTAVTAAVVGMMLSLALFLAWHVLWPQGWAGGIDTVAALLTLAAAWALLRARRSVIEVIAACASLGLLMGSLR